jgi:hypothetical protein
MRWSDILSIAAVLISVLAAGLSTALAARQARFMRQANHLPVIMDLLNEFRSVEFNERYEYVCARLQQDHSPSEGVTGLPREARSAVYDVVYFYQLFATLVGLGILDEKPIIAVLNHRIVRVWQAVKPFALRERELDSAGRIICAYSRILPDMQRRPTRRLTLV